MSSTSFYSSSSTGNIGQVAEINLAATQTPSYLKPNSFKFQIGKLPNVTYTCQSINLPSLNLSAAQQLSPFVDIPHPGDKIVFGEFSIRYLVNEDMSNYRELYNWMISMGTPGQGSDYAKTFNRATVFDSGDYNSLFSDANVVIIDSNNRPVVKLNFQDLFPTSIEGLDFDITSSGMEYFVGTASFRYKLFTIETL
jgi:hypothetical protein